MRHSKLFLVLLMASLSARAQSDTKDNRLPKSAVGMVFPVTAPDEVEVLDLMRSAQKPDY